jgi:uncharacterized membrane protein
MPTDPLAQPDETPIPPSSLPPYTPPPVGSIPPPVAATVGPTTTGLEPNIAAGLSTLATFITGIVFLLIEKKSPYVRFWAMQSIVFGIAWFAFFVISAVIYGVLHAIFWPLGLLWWLASSIMYLGFLLGWIIMIIQAFSGKEWELPFLGKIARQQLARMPVV